LGNTKIIKKTTNKSRQTNTQKTKEQATRTLLKTGRGGGVTDVFGKGKRVPAPLVYAQGCRSGRTVFVWEGSVNFSKYTRKKTIQVKISALS
jgi:hypothetical protein